MSKALTLSLEKNTFLPALQTVCSVVERKSTLPVVSNVLLELAGKTLTLTGTDCEIELKSVITLEEEYETLRTTLPGRKLLDICRSLPDATEIKLKFNTDSKVVLTSDQRRFMLSTLPAEDFPVVHLNQPLAEFELPQTELRQLIEHTYFAMAQQDVRHFLNGMLLEVSKNEIRTVAADGHRLATSSVNVSLNVPKAQHVIIPRKGVLELLRLLKEDEMHVSVSLFPHHLQMKGGKYTFISKLVEGRYPDYQKVLPLNTDKTVLADRVQLLQNLQSAAILIQEKTPGVWIKIQPQLIQISANNQEHDEAEIEMGIDYAGEEMEIALNVVYLMDVLQALQESQVQIHFGNPETSTLLTSVPRPEVEQKEGPKSMYVIMPMRI